MRTKKAAGRTAAKKNELRHKAYPQSAQLSSLKYRLLVETRGLVDLFLNPFLSQGEKETCQILLFSTIRKLIVLQNGYCGGCGCVETKNSD